MSVQSPLVVESNNLSHAWGHAMSGCFDFTARTARPLIISVGGFDQELPAEDQTIRAAVDAAMAKLDRHPVRISAMTIMPFEMWDRRGRPDVVDFCRTCTERLLPRMKARNPANRLGTYFERLMAYSGAQRGQLKTVNQLEFVIQLLRNRARRPRESALQMACFDPAKDHTGQPVRGFPCLQQIAVSYNAANELAIHAYYPTQYVFDRGYGNYLGLCHLGAFIAHHCRMRFTRLNCYVARPLRGEATKSQLLKLIRLVRRRLRAPTPIGANP